MIIMESAVCKATIFNKAKYTTQGRIRLIVEELLPNGKIIGREYLALNPTRCDYNLGSFRINLDSGAWIDFATNDSGNDLVSLCSYIRRAEPYSAAQYIVDSFGDAKYLLEDFYMKPPKVAKVPKVGSQDFSKLWNSCLDPHHSKAEIYLRKRGYEERIPACIKYCPNLKHYPSGKYLPAMVCAIRDEADTLIGVHRTYLSICGTKKADVIPNKMIMGTCKGGAVKFAKADCTLILAEGIETSLSVYTATNIPTWATLSTSGLVNIIVPPIEITQEIIIAADHDEPGLKAASKLADRLVKQGYKVKIMKPYEEGKDFNDVLSGGKNVR